MFSEIVQIFFLLLFIYLSVITLYFLVTSVAGKFISQARYSHNPKKYRFAILIPTYQEDDVIIHTAEMARAHNYPRECFDIFVGADQLQPGTLNRLRKVPVNVIEMNFEMSSKARSLNHLLNIIPEGKYDIALILDEDNIMMPGCLEMINDAFHKGFRAVQVHRTAKNQNTDIAVLDAISEEVNNHLFRRSQRALGFSSNTIGSGMAFEFNKLKEIYNKPGILTNPACDREVDYEIMKSNITIEYIDKAYVLDEKVAHKHTYEKQRTRWLESQFAHLKMFFSSKEAVKNKTKDYWNKLFTNLIPPRLLILLGYAFIFVIYLVQVFFKFTILTPDPIWWLFLFILSCFIIFISIPTHLFSIRSAKAVFHVPSLVISMLRALLRIRPGRKEFLHTPKTFVSDSSGKEEQHVS